MQLIFFICCWAICSLFKRRPHKRRRITTTDRTRQRQTVPVYSPPPITMYDVKKAERDRMQAAKKAQTQRDIERLEEQAKILNDMLVNAQYMADEDGETPQYYERMQNKIISLQNRLATAENKIEKAKYIIKYGA